MKLKSSRSLWRTIHILILLNFILFIYKTNQHFYFVVIDFLHFWLMNWWFYISIEKCLIQFEAQILILNKVDVQLDNDKNQVNLNSKRVHDETLFFHQARVADRFNQDEKRRGQFDRSRDPNSRCKDDRTRRLRNMRVGAGYNATLNKREIYPLKPLSISDVDWTSSSFTESIISIEKLNYFLMKEVSPGLELLFFSFTSFMRPTSSRITKLQNHQ